MWRKWARVWAVPAEKTEVRDQIRDKGRERMAIPFSSMGGTRSWRTGPSGRYIRTGTLLTLYAPSLSGCPDEPGSADGGRVCIEVAEGGGGEYERFGEVVGVTFAATRQYSSKLSTARR